ncbi:MAG: cell division protein ZapA [Sphingomonadaceae bacterium]
MASVTLDIGGNQYAVSCRDGEELHLKSLAAIVDAKATEARGAVGGAGEVRQLLLAALLLADELDEARKAAIAPVEQPATASQPAAETEDALITLADYAESLAARLENMANTS